MPELVESRLIHEDWWGKCRSCRFWAGSDGRRMAPGHCSNPASDMHQLETWTDGHCPKWDTFDIDTALDIMETDERGSRSH